MNTSSPRSCSKRAPARLLACLAAAALPLAAPASAQQDCVTFNDLATGLILDAGVFTDGGIGPIRVDGFNPDLGATNAAIIFDSANPSGEDPDLGTPNEDFGGPGIGIGGEAGSPFQNDADQFQLLIIAEDLVDTSPNDGLVDDPDDADVAGSTLEFDFTPVGPVVIRSITQIDTEEDRAAPTVDLYDDSNFLLLSFDLQQPGDNGVAVNVFPQNGNVSRMVITVSGSGGFDDLCLELYRDCNDNDIHDADDIANGTSEDCDGNGVPDECDPDCDGDGTPDACEDDCDGDGIPDDCEMEPDCNGNNIPDDCDIADGTSTDLNMNGIPDECDPDCDGDGIPDDIREDCDGDGIPDDCEDDCDGDGVPDDCDTEPDCNNNGIPDNCDIADGTSDDCDGNGVPDECDPDCDGDGVPDDCDTRPDCNMNDVPDNCDIANGTSDDCNGNGVPDECEDDCDGDGIPDDCEDDCDGDGFPDDCDSEPDCNGNNVPDNCDIADGTSADRNGNGIPDECEEVGLPYCTPNLPNSTGQPGTLLCTGSDIAADEDLTLTASNLPPGNICLFIASQNQGLIQPPRSCGNLCLMGPDIARFKFDAQQVDDNGQCSLTIDPWIILTNPPQPILAGQTWYFQGWHRDADAGPDCNNNFTDACCVTFQ